MIYQMKADEKQVFLVKVTRNIFVAIFHDKKILQKALICLAAFFFRVRRANRKSENCSDLLLA
jgi:hypothetical protein